MVQVTRTKKVLALSLGGTFNNIALIIAGVIAARLLTKHDYATMKQTILVYSFIAPLVMLGLSDALFYFLPKEKHRKTGIIIDNIVLLFVMALVFSAFLYLGGYKIIAHYFDNPDLLITLKWLIPYPVFMMPATILGAVLITQNKTYTFTIYNVISKFLLVSFIITGIFLTRSFTGPLIAQIYFPLLALPFILWLCFKHVPGKITLPCKQSMLKILNYSVPLGLSGMLGTITLMTDKVIVSTMCTPEKFANYVNGAIEIPLIGIITGSIASIILVDMVKYIDQEKKIKALKLFKKAAVKSAIVLFPVMIFLLISGKSLILTLYSEKYEGSVAPFYIYLFILPIRIVIYGSAMMALGQTKAILFRSLFDFIINIFLSILFIQLFGYLGAAIATIVTLYFWTVPFNLYKIGQGFELKAWQILPLKQISQIMLLSILASPIALTYILNNNHEWWIQLIVSSIFYFPIILCLLYKYMYIKIPEKFNKYIPSVIKVKLK